MTSKLERDYQASLIKKLKVMFPGCQVLKNDTSYQQGIPDLSVFWRDRYAVLEVKPHEGAREEPNQRYFVDTFNEMSFAAFICPENEEEVLDELQQAWRSRRKARLPQR